MTDKPQPDYAQIVAHVMAEVQKKQPPSEKYILAEKAKCAADPVYFINTYCRLLDNIKSDWIAFTLWPAQEESLRVAMANKYTVVLKARQQGFTWLLGVAYPLWLMLFRPIATIVVFSQGETEAKEVIKRIGGMYENLPTWLRGEIKRDNVQELELVNQSRVFARTSTSGGRGTAATLVVIDEIDFVENIEDLMAAAKPTIDAGNNQMVVLSTKNPTNPESYFKRLYMSAKEGVTEWKPLFMSWRVRPERTDEWYEKMKTEALYTHGNLDNFYKEYPSTDLEALSAPSTANRISSEVISRLYSPRQPLVSGDASRPIHPALKYFGMPVAGRRYSIGVDPASGTEGKEFDDSVIQVIDSVTFEQMAVVQGRINPTNTGRLSAQLADFYNHATILYERNNHGAVLIPLYPILALEYQFSLAKDNKKNADGNTKPGWVTSAQSKITLYDNLSDILAHILEDALARNETPDPIIFDSITAIQLGSINNETLEAPNGFHDDLAIALAFAYWAARPKQGGMKQLPHTFYDKKQQASQAQHSQFPQRPATVNRSAPVARPDTAPDQRKSAQELAMETYETWMRLKKGNK